MKRAPKHETWRTCFDTVLIPLPALSGGSFELFRDVAGKGEAVTNVRVPRRAVNAGATQRLQRVSCDVWCWDGDDMREALWQQAMLELRVNGRICFAEPLRRMRGQPQTLPGDTLLNENDELAGRIVLSPVPWPAPTQHVLIEKPTYHETKLAWLPGFLPASEMCCRRCGESRRDGNP